MRIKDFFRENMLLEVYDPASGVYYKSLLQEVNAGGLAIGVPLKERKKLKLQQGTEYLFRVLLDDALYYFNSKVVGGKKSARVFLYLLNWPENIKRRQRRHFYRLDHTINVDYWVLANDLPPKISNKKREVGRPGGATLKIVSPEKWNVEMDQEILALYRQVEAHQPAPAVATNLSGGGLMLVARRNLPPGTVLALRFFLQSSKKNKKMMLVKGRIVRLISSKAGEDRHYRYGVEFLEMSERTQDEIVRFIFFMLRHRLL